MAVLTLSEAKAHLGITSSTNDGELAALVASAEAAIAQLVGPLEPTTVTTSRIMGGSEALFLPVLPAISLTTISDASNTALVVGDYYLDKVGGMVSTAAYTATLGSRFYTITYVAGRTVCPPDLLLAVKELVRHLWESQRGPTRAQGAFGEGMPDMSGAGYLLPYRVQELIAPHMQYSIA